MLGFLPSLTVRPVRSRSTESSFCNTCYQKFSRQRLTQQATAVSRRSILSCASQEVSPPASEPIETDDPLSSGGIPESTPEPKPEEGAHKLLKWSEIAFTDMQEELKAIDEYEKSEELREDDSWPKFLRGAAYEYWGQPQLALAQYALTKHAAGLRMIPALWERRAYNAFKLGEVCAANAYFDLASALHGDAGGNPLHFSHWFDDNFANFVPKQSGPAPPLQHAISKYCVSEWANVVEQLVGQLASVTSSTQHSLLWFLAAASRKASSGKVSSADVNTCNRVLQADVEWDERLGQLVMLFSNAVQGNDDDQLKYYNQIIAITESDAPHIDITLHSYLALYHDSFTGDVEKRDQFFDNVCSVQEPTSSRDTENFLYFAMKNRLTAPPDGTMNDIPDLR